ncbi:epoxide hydrolase family protein [Amycolatopsis lexingtonensis]|uniref:epoxide hydrolase family protein n=1 Tax=Amycolatopsis lexingtonensis TaxID=218822 RepID=UPI003F6FFEB8
MPQPEPFRIAVPDEDIRDLRERLARTRLPGDLANDGWEYGTNQEYLAGLLADWRDSYDWRAHEAEMNAYAHYRVELDGQPVHYLHVPGDGKVPLLLIGGWPWTFWDFKEVLPHLAGHEVVVADLPGYGFSTPLARPGIGYAETADMYHRLMTEVLGHERYGIYGSDWGSIIGQHLAHHHPEAVVGLHTTMPFSLEGPIPEELWADDEKVRRAANTAWARYSNGYFVLHTTRPQSIAYIGDSPAATAAWLVEKLHDWTDHDGDFETGYPRERVLTTLSLFWFTNSMGSTARLYAESFQKPWTPKSDAQPLFDVPTAVAAYPREPAAVPRKWVESRFDLRRYTVMERGGHYPAVESPETLGRDIAGFFAELAEG